jgi:hypothetical protein
VLKSEAKVQQEEPPAMPAPAPAPLAPALPDGMEIADYEDAINYDFGQSDSD